MKILMLSGITGTGKSTLFRYLEKNMDMRDFSSNMFFSSYHCQNYFKEAGICFEKLYEFYQRIFEMEKIEYSKKIGVLFENSFYNVCLEYGLDNKEIMKMESLFNKYQCKQVLLTIPETEIYQRSIVTTRIYRKPSWTDYLNRFNLSDGELTDMFLEKQKRLSELVNKSSCPALIINTSEMDWDLYIEEINRFWVE